MDRKNRNPLLVPLYCSLLFILIYIYILPLLLSWDNYFTFYPKNIPSWYSNFLTVVVPGDAVLRYHQPPFWIPVLDGGIPANELPVAPPFGFLHLLYSLFGINVALKLYWSLFLFAGAFAMFYLAYYVLNIGALGALYAGLVFSMSGAFAYLFENGFLFCRELFLLPLLCAFFIKSEENYSYVVWSSFVLVIILLHSALFFPVTILFLFLYSLLELLLEKKTCAHPFRRLRRLVAVCFLTVLLGVFKILPVLMHLRVNNWISGQEYKAAIHQANTLELLYHRLFTPENYGAGTMYIGFLPVLAALAGTVLCWKQFRKYICLLVIFLLLSFGPNCPMDLHRILWELPVFKSISEIAKYYAVFIVFLIAILGGAFFSFFNNNRFKLWLTILLCGYIAWTYADLLKNARYYNVFNESVEPVTSRERFPYFVKGLNFHKGEESISALLTYFLYQKNVGLLLPQVPSSRGVGVVPKYFLLPQYAFLMPSTGLLAVPNPEYRGEFFFVDRLNSVTPTNVGPNIIELNVKVGNVPATLVINQNYDRHWKSSRGQLNDFQGRIAVMFSESFTGSIRLKYLPFETYVGIGISLATFIACVVFLFRRRGAVG